MKLVFEPILWAYAVLLLLGSLTMAQFMEIPMVYVVIVMVVFIVFIVICSLEPKESDG